jgi:hypothetical protein
MTRLLWFFAMPNIFFEEEREKTKGKKKHVVIVQLSLI